MQNVLVTGGAGYIGSHACKALKAAGFNPVTFDNISTGWEDAVKFGPLEKGDLLDRARLDEVFAKHEPVAVMHFAALSQVGESMQIPGKYWLNNVQGSLNLIEAATEAGLHELCLLVDLCHLWRSGQRGSGRKQLAVSDQCLRVFQACH